MSCEFTLCVLAGQGDRSHVCIFALHLYTYRDFIIIKLEEIPMKNEYIVSKIDLRQLSRSLGGMELLSYCSR